MFLEAHKEQRRKSGAIFSIPIAVAKIVASDRFVRLRLPQHYYMMLWKTLLRPLRILNEFNPKVAQLVEGLTKISLVQKDMNVSMQAENFRKMLLTLNDDVILLK
jgi:GTP pyrophosphokinase